MRYVRMLGLVGLVAGAMMAVAAGGVQATVITQAPPFTGTVKAESEGAVSVTGTIVFTCQKSALEWSVESHGASVTTTGPLTKVTLEECGTSTVTVVEMGKLELHATSGGDGTLTSTGTRITVLVHSVFLGTVHCIYETKSTDVGTLTGSATTGATATLDVASAVIPLVSTDGTCREDAQLEGSYTFTSPDYLYVD